LIYFRKSICFRYCLGVALATSELTIMHGRSNRRAKQERAAAAKRQQQRQAAMTL
jgi:hypothetical protein